MKRIGKFGVLGSLAFTTALAATLVGYAPKTCGCVGPTGAFSLVYGVPYDSMREPNSTAILAINGAIVRAYQGKPVPAQDDMPLKGCAAASGTKSRIECTYWLWAKPGSEAGVKITIQTSTSRVFVSSQSELIVRSIPSVKAGG